jgi:chaperonin GroEL (HSP60 family)
LWTKDIQVPGEAIIVKGLKTIDEKVSSLRVDDEKLTRRLKEITALKKILYEQGEPLEKAVRTALSELGLPARKEGDIDLVTIEEKEPLIIEITGSEGLIGIDKFRQLLNYVMTEQEQGKEIPKSVLIANHQISTPPEKRSNPFTDKAVEQAKVFHSCLLPTVELFNAVVLLREGRIDQKRFRDALMKTDGVFASSQLIREAKP